MRIIGGQFKGRKFHPPAKKWPTRPTTDYAKEGLFNILLNRIDIEDTKMLDLFGGTGNHSYEFLSRYCTDVTYVDKFYPAVQFVKEVAKELQVDQHIKVVKSDVFKFIKYCKEEYDYIFAGPPYALEHIDEVPDRIFKNELLAKDGLLVVEHDPSSDFQDHPRFIESRTYGLAIFSFFQWGNE